VELLAIEVSTTERVRIRYACVEGKEKDELVAKKWGGCGAWCHWCKGGKLGVKLWAMLITDVENFVAALHSILEVLGAHWLGDGHRVEAAAEHQMSEGGVVQ
jgi:hypothetical protein